MGKREREKEVDSGEGTAGARQSMQLVRSAFIGFFDLIHIVDNEERNLAEFLTAEGMLIRDEESKDKFKMSSVLVRQSFNSLTKTSFPKHSIDCLKQHVMYM